MSMLRLLKRSVLGVLVVLALMMVGGVSSAFALSAWWHLSSGARPTSIQAGVAESEVQEVAVSGNEGRFVLAGPESNVAFFQWNATHEEVQAGLEGIYGKGNVSVTGGPGDETGSKPYIVAFVGELAGASIELVSVSPETVSDQLLIVMIPVTVVPETVVMTAHVCPFAAVAVEPVTVKLTSHMRPFA